VSREPPRRRRKAATLRILQINKFYDSSTASAGGAGTYLSVVAPRLTRAGHEVLRFGCVPPQAPQAGTLPEFIDYTQLPSVFAKVRGALRIVHNADAARKLDTFLGARHIDVAHVHNLYHHLTPSILPVLRRRGIPIVMSLRDHRIFCPAKHFLRGQTVCTECLPHRWWRCVARRCAGGAAASAAVAFETFFQRFFRRYIENVRQFLCPSRFAADVALADGFPAGKVQVLPNPIESPPAPDGAASDGKGILYVGRLSPEKGPDLILDLAEAFGDTPVTIVGDGPAGEDLRRQAEQRRLGHITWVGHVRRQHLGRYYARAAVVVVPSRCFEVSPHVMLEAMLAGRAVVGPNHGPISEWITDGRTGRLFRPNDSTDLVRVVGEVLADPAGRARMGAAAVEVIRRRHDPERIVARLMRIYQQLADGDGRVY